MDWWVGALLAALGALAAEMAEVDLLRRQTGRLPWNRRSRSVVNGQVFPPLSVYLVGITMRLVVAGIAGGVFASADQVTGSLGAFTLGIAASLLVSRISAQKPLGDQPHPLELSPPTPPRPEPTTPGPGTPDPLTMTFTDPSLEMTQRRGERGAGNA